MDDLKQLEAITAELLEAFEISAPPVPIESMLQRPRAGMWEEVDINQLSGSFLSIKEQFSPRMSLARLLVRHIASSPWGRERGLMRLLKSDELIRTFARMLVMPHDMVVALSGGARNPMTMSMHFEVPEEDARVRLQELSTYANDLD